ncbi:MAG: endonuclease III [Spirochaetaceae bacterium 4572_59]|nr:MAG: endonuclease III [Spirochaetaceae bacterium 4572_59]
MKSSERARIITGILREEYPDRKPLLDYRNPYELLIAVILSAQTTDAGVNKVTPPLFSNYPSPRDLSEALQVEVEEIIHSTGFFRVKAANIIKTARILADQYAGQVPGSMKELVALPGVGRKTANVILNHIFDEPAIIVDTHFIRVSNRLGFTDKKDPEQIERQLKAEIPEDIQSEFSMTVNLHGRKYCHPRKPECGSCPIKDYCPSVLL